MKDMSNLPPGISLFDEHINPADDGIDGGQEQGFVLEWVRVQDGLPDFDEYVLWRTQDYNYFVEALDKDGDMVDTTWATHWTRFKGQTDA